MADLNLAIVIKAIDQASAQLAQVQRALNNTGITAEASSGKLSGLATNIASMASGFVAAQVGMASFSRIVSAVGDSVIGLNSRLENAKIAFTSMLGSGEQAEAFLRRLQQFAAQTPFEFPELVQASQRMLAMGFAAERVVPLLTAVGNAAAAMGGSSEMIDRITVALGQMQAKTRVSAEEMLQLTEAGIPAWQLLADAVGKTVPEVQKLAEQGQITADVMIAAFEKFSQAQYGDMMAQQALTFTGAMSTIKDSITMALAQAGKPFFDWISSLAVRVSQFVQGDQFAAWAERVRGVLAQLVSAGEGFATMISAIPTPLLNALAALTGLGVAGAALAGALALTTKGVVALIGSTSGLVTSMGAAIGAWISGTAAVNAQAAAYEHLTVAQAAARLEAIALAQQQAATAAATGAATAATKAGTAALAGLPGAITGVLAGLGMLAFGLASLVKQVGEDKQAVEEYTDALKKGEEAQLSFVGFAGRAGLPQTPAFIEMASAARKAGDEIRSLDSAYKGFAGQLAGNANSVIASTRATQEALRAQIGDTQSAAASWQKLLDIVEIPPDKALAAANWTAFAEAYGRPIFDQNGKLLASLDQVRAAYEAFKRTHQDLGGLGGILPSPADLAAASAQRMNDLERQWGGYGKLYYTGPSALELAGQEALKKWTARGGGGGGSAPKSPVEQAQEIFDLYAKAFDVIGKIGMLPTVAQAKVDAAAAQIAQLGKSLVSAFSAAWPKQAADAAAATASTLGTVIETASKGFDLLSKLSTFTSVASERIEAFVANLLDMSDRLVAALAGRWSPETLVAGALVAQTIGTMLDAAGKGFDLLSKLKDYTTVAGERMDAFVTDLGAITTRLEVGLQRFWEDPLLAASATIADPVGKLVSGVSGAVGVLASLRGYVSPGFGAIDAFAGDLNRIAGRLRDSIGGFNKDLMVNVLAPLGEAVGKFVSGAGNAVSTLKSLADYVGLKDPEGIAQAFASNLATVSLALEHEIGAWDVANYHDVLAPLGEAVGTLMSGAGQGLQLLSNLAAWKPLKRPEEIGQAFATQLATLTRLLAEAVKDFDQDALDIAAGLTESAGKILSGAGTAIDPLLKLSEYTGLGAKADEIASRFAADVGLVIDKLTAALVQIGEERLREGSPLAEAASKVTAFLASAIDPLTKLAEYKGLANMYGSRKALDRFIGDLAATFDALQGFLAEHPVTDPMLEWTTALKSFAEGLNAALESLAKIGEIKLPGLQPAVDWALQLETLTDILQRIQEAVGASVWASMVGSAGGAAAGVGAEGGASGAALVSPATFAKAQRLWELMAADTGLTSLISQLQYPWGGNKTAAESAAAKIRAAWQELFPGESPAEHYGISLAAGGIVTRPTLALIGEAGPEAVVPLSAAGARMVPTVINVTVNTGDLVAEDPSGLAEQVAAMAASAVQRALGQQASRRLAFGV